MSLNPLYYNLFNPKLDCLKLFDRNIFKMLDNQNLTFIQIASLLGCSIEDTEARVNRIITDLYNYNKAQEKMSYQEKYEMKKSAAIGQLQMAEREEREQLTVGMVVVINGSELRYKKNRKRKVEI